MNTNEITTEKLMTDLKAVVRDAEELLAATAGDAEEKVKRARDRLGAALESARATCGDWEGKAAAGAKAADQLVREHPYESIGIALGLGLLLGVLVNRK